MIQATGTNISKNAHVQSEYFLGASNDNAWKKKLTTTLPKCRNIPPHKRPV